MIKEAGVIAAGLGTRLAAVKPLIDVAGKPLCHWVIRGLESAGVCRVTFLHNSRGGAARQSLAKGFPGLRWNFLEADTGSSWESFRLVCRNLAQHSESFLVSTVDALIPPREVARFAAAMRTSGAAAGLALTPFVDDEKPLWADLGEDGRVCARHLRAVFHDRRRGHGPASGRDLLPTARLLERLGFFQCSRRRPCPFQND